MLGQGLKCLQHSASGYIHVWNMNYANLKGNHVFWEMTCMNSATVALLLLQSGPKHINGVWTLYHFENAQEVQQSWFMSTASIV